MSAIRNIVSISTPEHVKVPFETAGIGTRSLAKLVDFFCVGGVLIPLGLVTYTVLSVLSLATSYLIPSILVGVSWVLLAFVPIMYFTFTEYWLKGQTLGKMIFNLRVIADDGQNPSFSSIFLRNVIQLVDLLPGFYLLGLVTIFFHPKEKRIGDLVAGTLVIQERTTQMKKIAFYHTTLSLSKKDKENFKLLTVISSEFFRILESFLGRRKDLEEGRRRVLADQLIKAGWPNIEVYAGKEELFLEKIYLYLREHHYVADQPVLVSEYYSK